MKVMRMPRYLREEERERRMIRIARI